MGFVGDGSACRSQEKAQEKVLQSGVNGIVALHISRGIRLRLAQLHFKMLVVRP